MKKGFTVVELAVVMIIFFVLTLLVLFGIYAISKAADYASQISDTKKVCIAIAEKMVDHEVCPDTNDVWGTPIHAVATESIVTVESAGPDKSFGTGDDIKIVRHIKPMKAIGKSIGRGATQLGKGIKEGVKEELLEK